MVKIKQRKSLLKEEREQEKTQKELKKAGIQDEFQIRGFELVSWAHDHQKSILLAIVAIVLGAGFWSGFALFQQSKNEEASVQYQKALEILNNEKEDEAKNKKAAEAFRRLSKDYKGSKVSGLAQLYAGYLALELNAPSEAVADYQHFLADFKGELKPLAVMGLAYANVKKGNKQEALDAFETVINSDWNIASEETLWESARLASELKQWNLAKKRASELMAKHPNSPLFGAAEDILNKASQAG